MGLSAERHERQPFSIWMIIENSTIWLLPGGLKFASRNIVVTHLNLPHASFCSILLSDLVFYGNSLFSFRVYRLYQRWRWFRPFWPGMPFCQS